ncbi:MAG: hypothetical protein ACOC9P_01490 [bacterium]
MTEPRFSWERILQTLRAIDAVARQQGRAWVPWNSVARQLGGDIDLADQLSAAFELHALNQYVRQNRTGNKVTLSDMGRQSVREQRLVDWPPARPNSEQCWVYYSRYRQPPGTFRLVMHYASCADCNHGRGHTDAPYAQIDPSHPREYLPISAWVGPFEGVGDAVAWCQKSPALRRPPQRCARCFGMDAS